jgi:acetylornithine/succinyldiaminopimelate/putrescine aminotransferase
MSKGILANCTNGNVIRLLPPLIIQEEHVDMLLSELREVMHDRVKVATK